jgi:hypothetical protein
MAAGDPAGVNRMDEELLLKVGEYISLHDEIIEAVQRQDEGFIERLNLAYKAMRECYVQVSMQGLQAP